MAVPEIVVAPDAQVEVDAIFARLEQWCEDGASPTQITFLADSSYDDLIRTRGVQSELFNFGLTLASSATARLLLTALELHDAEFSRTAIWNWLASSPVRWQGAPSPYNEWRRELRSTGNIPQSFAEFLVTVAQICTPPAKHEMAELATWSETVLRTFVGAEADVGDWPAAEREALTGVYETLYQIADQPGETSVRRFVLALKQRLGQRTTNGANVIMHSIDDTKVLDQLAIFGCCDMREPSGAVLACDVSQAVIVGIPRLDPLTRQPSYPSGLVLRTLNQQQGRVVRADELFADDCNFANVTTIDSFHGYWQKHLRQPDTSLSQDAQRRAAEFVTARSADEFTAFDGQLDTQSHPVELPRPTNVSFLHNYLACGFATFLDQELGVTAEEKFAETVVPDHLDRGSVIHEILQQFIRAVKPREEPDEKWTVEERALLRSTIDSVLDEYAADSPTLMQSSIWAAERNAIVAQLASFCDADEAFRAQHRVVPMGVEVGFGGSRDQWPALTVERSDRSRTPVALRGRIDRIDQSVDGDRILVTDYKSGNAAYAPTFGDDPTEEGTSLQLPIYAEVLQRQFPAATIDAGLWYVADKKQTQRRFVYDSDVADTTREAIDTIADVYESGAFHPYPGEELPWGFANCSSCPFDRICPSDRAVKWARVQEHIESGAS